MAVANQFIKSKRIGATLLICGFFIAALPAFFDLILANAFFSINQAGVSARYAGESNYLYFFPVVKQEIPIWIDHELVDFGRGTAIAVEGYVYNLTSSPVYSVTLMVNITDSMPPIPESNTVIPGFAAVLPGQPNPFILYTDAYEIDEYEVGVKTWSWDNAAELAPVSIVSKEVIGICEYHQVTGEIRNDQAFDLYDIVVLIKPGLELVGFQQAELDQDALAPGETTKYSTVVWDPGVCGPVPSELFQVWGQGILDKGP